MTTFILGMAFTQMLVFPKLQKAVGLLRLASLVAVANGLVLLGCSLVTSSERLPLWLALFPLNILSTALASPIVNIKVADLAPKECVPCQLPCQLPCRRGGRRSAHAGSLLSLHPTLVLSADGQH